MSAALLALTAAALLAASPVPKVKSLPHVPGVGRVVAVEVKGEVDAGLAAFLQRVLAVMRDDETLLLEVDTLGGRLDSALAIRDALLASKVTSVCWVKPRAISAGALISLACDVIAVTPDATMGAATPVAVGLTGGVSPVDAKVTSFMRKEMAATATAQGRPPEVAEAMVDTDVDIPNLNPRGRLLTLSSQEALAWGVAELQAATPAELWQKLGRDVPALERPSPSFAESFARLLALPGVSLVLIALGLLGVLFELLHPSHGVALVAGLTALGLFFFGQYVVHLAGWEELLLIGLGLLLLLIEALAPGHTVFGVTGGALLVAGLSLALVDLQRLPLGVAWAEGALPAALTVVLGASLLAVAGFAVAWRYVPHTRFGKSLVLEEAVTATAAPPERGIGLPALVGQVGVALTDLRPGGRVEVINHRAEARAELGFISAGTPIRVVRAESGHVVVRPEVG